MSLSNEDVIGYLFWTRYARPFAKALRDLLDEGIPCAFQYTINGYGGCSGWRRSSRVLDLVLQRGGHIPNLF